MLVFITMKYYSHQIRCVLKVLTNTKHIQHLTIKPILNVQYISNPNINIKNQPCFSQVFEMKIPSISSHRYMTYDYCKKINQCQCVNLN